MILLIAGILLSTSGCHPTSLSREESAGLIAHSEEFKLPAYHEISLGPDLRGGLGGLLNSVMGTFDFELMDCLTGMGYLTKDHRGFVLTEKGREAEKGWGKDPERPNGRMIPVAEPEFIEVTGIAQTEGSIDAEVEYKWRWKWASIMNGMDCTDCGTDCQISMSKQYGYQYSPQPRFDERRGTARFRRYDDGWRLQQLGTHE